MDGLILTLLALSALCFWVGVGLIAFAPEEPAEPLEPEYSALARYRLHQIGALSAQKPSKSEPTILHDHIEKSQG